MSNAFDARLDMLTANDSGPAPLDARHALVVHTFEGRDLSAVDMATYQLSPAAGGSYHLVIDAGGDVVRENDDEYQPWAAMQTGNRIGFHFSLAGQAAFTRAQWLNRTPQLEALADVLSAYSQRYGIPLRRINPDELRNGVRGVCGHHDVSLAYGESDHTDPGAEFPYDVVIAMAGDNPGAGGDMREYTVAPGDTLTKIAHEHGTTVHELQETNCIPDADHITVGQRITLP